MDVQIQDVSPVEKKLVVEVPWNVVNTKLLDAYRNLARGVQIKGFRKGKVPRSVLERMFGKRVRAEVATQLVRESFVSAATEKGLEAVSEPRVDQELVIKSGQPFAFEAIVEVRGEVEAKDYDGLELTRPPFEIADDALENALKSLQEEHTELMPIEGRDITARTDVLTIKISGTLGDKDFDRPSFIVDLSQQEREQLPGLVAALTGLPVDVQDHGLELPIPEDYHDEGLAGTTASFTVSITDARQKQLPEIDDEFAKDVGRGETVDELRDGIRKDLLEERSKAIKRQLRDDALREVIKRNQIPVAGSLVDRATDMQYRRLQRMFGGVVDDSTLGTDLREKMRPAAIDEVRGQLLLEAIADKEQVSVGDGDIDTYISEMASMSGVNAARLRAEYERDGKLDNVRFQLKQDKTLDLIVERATVTEVEPSEQPDEDTQTDLAAAPEANEAREQRDETPPAGDTDPAEPESSTS